MAPSRQTEAARFLASMPRHYREAFDRGAIEEHAAIVARRGSALAHAEIWRPLQKGGVVVCFVADDRPGLLSLITASVAAEKLDITAVHAYTRPPAGGRSAEAVDFFSLRREGVRTAAIGTRDVSRVVDVLRGLVAGEVALDSIVLRSRPPGSSPTPAATTVSFADTLDAGNAVLTVETADRPGLLLAITLALHRAQIQIVGSKATTGAGRVMDRFTIAENDGRPLARDRHRAVEDAVLSAVESLDVGARGKKSRA